MKLKRHMPLAVMVLLLSLCLIGSVSTGLAAVFAAPAVDEVHSITSEEDGITQNQLDAMAIDKQSWKLQEHMTWADYKANPVVDWEDATDHSIAPSRPLRGALILCDFPDVPMISGDALSSELMGNPQHRADREDLAEFWVDFLNTPGKMNNFMTFNGYILENSYGDWAVEMDAFGPYQLSGFEFQYGFWSSGNTAFDDYTFSRQFPRTPSGSGANTEAFRLALEDGVEFFDPETGEMIYNFVFVLHAGYDQSGSWQELGEMMFLGRDKIAAVPKGELKHPLTGKLLPDISGMDFTGWARIKKIQEIVEDPDFNLRAEWPNFYMLDIERTWRNQTATGAVYTAALGAHEAGGKLEAAFDQFKIDYPFTDRTQTQFRDTVYRPEFAQDYANRQKLIDPDDPDSEFTEEWLAFAADNTDERILAKLKDLLEGAEESARTSTTNPYYQAVPTRYIPWSTWYGGVGIWSGAGSAIDTNVYLSIPLSIQGESDGMATFAHESGHLFGLPDNYNGPYDIPRTRSYTGPWDLMSRGSFGGPYGNHTRWDIPSVNGSSVPSNQVLRGKYVNGYSDLENDILYLNYAEIKDGLVITEIFGRNVPTNLGIKDKEGKEITGYRGLMIQGMLDQTPEETWAQISLPGSGTLRIDPFKWNWGPNGPGSNNAPGETRRFNGFSLEVMDKTGYDSFLPDHGVMIAKIANITANRAGPISTYIQDSHPDPLNLVDFTAADGTINMLSDGDQLQLASSLFHAGVHNDPNYYRDHSEKWLATDERTGVHGNVVNEYIDPYNKLHFYILDKIENPGKYGEFLSYQIAVRSTADDAAQVGGELTLAKGDFSEASEGNYAVQKFILEQSADANGTDIVRIKIEIDETKPAGALLEEDVVILNNLYTIEPGGEIRFDVYIKATDGVLESVPEGLEVKASSETALPTLGDVNLITDKEIEITYSEPVKSNEEAHEIFSVLVDGEEVEWEFLSYFNFGEYADRGGVVNLRLTEPLDVGEPRGRRRETAAETFLARTEHIKGPIAAEKVTVSLGGGTAKTAEWEPFYMERSLGNMSRLWVWGSAKAGNNGTQLLLANPNNYTSNNIFSATTDPLFTDEYIVRQVAEGINRFVGRSEYMNLPIIDSGFKALIVGPSQSVYEVPE
ncbi:MAG: hypothetical protein LBB91_00325, partial [Clostridiales bacterium]|nr:hypothetical protein [Clostridiales bacterium]